MNVILGETKCGSRVLPIVTVVFMCAVLMVGCFIFAATAKAAEEKELPESSDASGIKITTEADKAQYSAGDTAKIKVSVTNTNSYDMTSVKVDYKLPAGYSVTAGKLSQEIPSLASGETKEFEVSATVAENEYAEVVTSSYFTIPVIILIAVVVIALVVLVIFLIRKGMLKKAGKTGASVLVLLALLGGLISAAATPEITVYAEVKNEDFKRVSVHDPSVVKDPKSGMYYIFGSHCAFAKTKDFIKWETFRNNISDDYRELFKEPWEWAYYATKYSNKDAQVDGYCWAPDVIWNENMKKWCMYMSIDGDNWCSSICLLTADDIEGPYEYQGIVVYSGMNNSKTPPTEEMLEKTDIYKVLDKNDDLSRYANTSNACINAIDPCVKFDDNGDLYMSYGSWSAGIYMLKLDKNTGLRDYDTTYETKLDESDAYFGYKIAGGHYKSGEASYFLKVGDYWYMFISYGGFNAADGYQMRVYRSKNVYGPYEDSNGVSPIIKDSTEIKNSDVGVKIFGSYHMSGMQYNVTTKSYQAQVSQGHNSAIVDEDGKIFLVYHTRFQSETGKSELHSVRVHQMFQNEDGWLVAAPFEYSGETLADSYTADEVAGEYDFIYHEPTEAYTVKAGQQLGIVGDEDETIQTVDLKKRLIVNHRISDVQISVSYGHAGSAKVVVGADGTVTGDYSGTWKFTNGVNVEMNLNGVTYKGMFLKQADESTDRNERMTFTIMGGNVTAWGVVSDGDKPKAAEEDEE